MPNFEDRLRWALTDKASGDSPAPVVVEPARPVVNVEPVINVEPLLEVKCSCGGPYRWRMTPMRDAQGFITSVDLLPVARVEVP